MEGPKADVFSELLSSFLVPPFDEPQFGESNNCGRRLCVNTSGGISSVRCLNPLTRLPLVEIALDDS